VSTSAVMIFLLQRSLQSRKVHAHHLDQAIDLALAHNHSLKASRTLILQNQAQEITAKSAAPNPSLGVDTQSSHSSSTDFPERIWTRRSNLILDSAPLPTPDESGTSPDARDQTAVTRAQIPMPSALASMSQPFVTFAGGVDPSVALRI